MTDIIEATGGITSVPRLDPIYTGLVDDVKKVVDEIVESRDFERGFQAINNMLVYVKAVDDSVGMMLNGMSEIWNPDEHDGERFEEAALRKTGLKPVTIQRHLKIQKALPYVPEQFKEEILDKGFKEKIRIAQLVEGGYEMDERDWLRIAEAPNEKETDRIAREIKGVEPRTNWLSISIDSRGVLVVHTTRGHRECGRLFVDDPDPDVQKAIARLTGCTGVHPSTEY